MNPQIDDRLTAFEAGFFLWSRFREDETTQWFGSQSNGVVRLSDESGFTRFRDKEVKTCFHIWRGPEGDLLFAAPHGVFRYRDDTFTLLAGYTPFDARRVCSDGGAVLISEHNLLFRLYDDYHLDTVTSFESGIVHVSHKEGNVYWVGTRTGLYEFDVVNGQKREVLMGVTATYVIQDSEGGLWITTLDNGVFYREAKAPERLLPEGSRHFSFDLLKVLGNDLMLMGRESLLYNTGNGGYTTFTYNLPLGIHANKLSKWGDTYYLAAERGLWYGTQLDALSSSMEKVYVSRADPVDSETVLIQHSRKVYHLPVTKLDSLPFHSLAEPYILESYQIFNEATPVMSLVDGRRVWIATVGGLFSVDLDSREIDHLSDRHEALGCPMSGMLKTGNVLWLGTTGKGVFSFDIVSGELHHYTTASGLQSDYVSEILTDSLSWEIIVRSEAGFDIWNGSDWRNIPIRYPSFRTISSTVSSDGTLYYLSHGEVYAFDPNLWEASLLPPQLYLDSVRTTQGSFPAQKTYELKHAQNNVRIYFHGLSLRDGSELSYHYKITGEEDISGVLSEPILQLSALDPGDYQVEIWAVAPSGLQSEMLRFDISVLPPWWQTGWFRLLVVLLFFGVIYLFFRIRVLTYNRDVVREIMLAIVKRLKREKQIVLKDSSGHFVTIRMKDLRFIKSAGNYVEVHRVDSKRSVVRITMKKIETQLKGFKQFQRVHHSYIVNMDHVTVIGQTSIWLGADEIPVSRRKRNRIELPTEKVNIRSDRLS